MDAKQAQRVEKAVLKVLALQQQGSSMRQLVEKLTDEDTSLRGVDVKIVAMNLVAKGQAKLNERWQLFPAN